MALIDNPWARVRAPAPIPDNCTVIALQQLSDIDFAELIRSHLVPRDAAGEGRQHWDRLWLTLKTDDLAERTYDVLDDFLNTTEDALDSGNLDPAATKRAEKFRHQCEQAWQRMDDSTKDATPPLAWAGSAGIFADRRAQMVIATLVGAIARHRRRMTLTPELIRPEDDTLWATLSRVNLDPRDYPATKED